MRKMPNKNIFKKRVWHTDVQFYIAYGTSQCFFSISKQRKKWGKDRRKRVEDSDRQTQTAEIMGEGQQCIIWFFEKLGTVTMMKPLNALLYLNSFKVCTFKNKRVTIFRQLAHKRKAELLTINLPEDMILHTTSWSNLLETPLPQTGNIHPILSRACLCWLNSCIYSEIARKFCPFLAI